MLGIVSTLFQASCFLHFSMLHFFHGPAYELYRAHGFPHKIRNSEEHLNVSDRNALSFHQVQFVHDLTYYTLNAFLGFSYKIYIYFHEHYKRHMYLNNAICCFRPFLLGKTQCRTAYSVVHLKVFFPFDHYEISVGILMNRISATRFVARIRHHIIRNVLPYCALLNYTRTRIGEKGVFYA